MERAANFKQIPLILSLALALLLIFLLLAYTSSLLSLPFPLSPPPSINTAPSPNAPYGKDEMSLVVATTFPLYDFTRNLVGDKLRVELLISPGMEFHGWEPTPSTLSLLRRAQLLIYNGAGLEDPWLDELLEALGKDAPPSLDTSEELSLLPLPGGSGWDPHVWLDPLRAMDQVRSIKEALIRLDRAHAQEYERRAEAYLKELEALHEEISEGLEEYEGRVFVTLHRAFTYFADRYGLVLYPFLLEPHREPTPSELSGLMELVRDEGIRAIYAEPLTDPGPFRALAQQLGVRVMILDPMDGIREEDLRAGASYIIKMKENLGSLLEGFAMEEGST